MKNRPLVILVIGLLHLLEPFSKVFYLKVASDFTFVEVIQNILAIEDPMKIFEFWFLFPIGGIALLSVRKWSLPVFFSVQFYSIYSHLLYEKFTWPYVSETPLYSSMFLLLFNIGIMIYFLLPEVRRPFFDHKLRWWEPKLRFNIDIPCALFLKETLDSKQCRIVNISQTGAFICTEWNLNTDQLITLRFQYMNLYFSLDGRVVNVHSLSGATGFGVKFDYKSIWQNFRMQRLLFALRLLKV
jgi:hypothetical protein